jgi:hypothetical protein
VRRPPKVFARMTLALGVSMFVLYMLGKIVLFFNPPTDMDHACLNKTLAEVNQCAYDYQEKR